MKHLTLLILLFISYFGFNQKLSLDEIVINSNYSDSNFLTKFDPSVGVGFGIHHIFRKDKITNLILGVEYNNVNYKNANFNHPYITYQTAKKQNVKVNLHNIEFPLFLRINLNKTFFIKAGVLVNFIFFNMQKGVRIYYLPYNEKSFSENSIGSFPYPGAIIGTGVNYSIFNQQFFTAFNYSFFYNDKNYYRPVSSFNLSLGLKFEKVIKN